MFRSVCIPFDNSPSAMAAVTLAATIARPAEAAVTLAHVYAATLHDLRFRQMEGGLPESYRKEEKLAEQRLIHGDLIDRGLNMISQSYLDAAETCLAPAGITPRRVSLEGKNWKRLVESITASDHDLVIMGAVGLGHTPAATLGSVCERVARRIDRDLLVVREVDVAGDAPIVVALDGSPQSFGGLEIALWLGKSLGRPVEAVAVFDPHFHSKAFDGISRVLSPEASKVFRFKEQERLHAEIIDDGLARIYRGHLNVAVKLAAEQGVELKTTLRAGKAFEQILAHLRESRPWLLVMGRIGVHSDLDMDLGSATEHLLRQADCHLLLAARRLQPSAERIAEVALAWSEEAEARMARVPAFARNLARTAVMRLAVERGESIVTSAIIDACLGMARSEGGVMCPVNHRHPA
ncbi:MAG: universal stress protein [Magnetococcales bacterium]|nr:universal stress protein [Magnetococcales bacterium]